MSEINPTPLEASEVVAATATLQGCQMPLPMLPLAASDLKTQNSKAGHV